MANSLFNVGDYATINFDLINPAAEYWFHFSDIQTLKQNNIKRVKITAKHDDERDGDRIVGIYSIESIMNDGKVFARHCLSDEVLIPDKKAVKMFL